jgi:hypothetical protein
MVRRMSTLWIFDVFLWFIEQDENPSMKCGSFLSSTALCPIFST